MEGLDICAPVAPVFFSFDFICIHNIICDLRPSSSEITGVLVTFSRRHSRQCCLCDSGK